MNVLSFFSTEEHGESTGKTPLKRYSKCLQRLLNSIIWRLIMSSLGHESNFGIFAIWTHINCWYTLSHKQKLDVITETCIKFEFDRNSAIGQYRRNKIVWSLLIRREIKSYNIMIIIISDIDSMTSVQNKIKTLKRFVKNSYFLSDIEMGVPAMGQTFLYTMISFNPNFWLWKGFVLLVLKYASLMLIATINLRTGSFAKTSSCRQF